MERVFSAQLRNGIARPKLLAGWVRGWEIWSLPRRLRWYVLLVIAADLALIAFFAAHSWPTRSNLELFALLLACDAATVELTRRTSEGIGVAKDVYAVWELPVAILLPPLYALIVPIVRLALTQWRVRKAPVYRRMFTAAAIGLAYACGSVIFRRILPGGFGRPEYPWGHAEIWLLVAAVCAVSQWAVNQALVLTAVKAMAPETSIREALFGHEARRNDVIELCAALLVTLGLTASWLAVLIALPLTTMLQRAFRHDQLLHQARADAKTGLLNAATWDRLAAAEVSRAVRSRSPLAVAILDLDRFKGINDTYGHLLGDDVLRGVAGILGEDLRDYDLAGRFGGEEFVVLLPQTRAPDALRIAERLREHIARLPVHADGLTGRERVPVTVSIGVAALDAGTSRELTELLAAADAALYRAKASGRDQVQMISTSRGLSAVRPPAVGADDDTDAAWTSLPQASLSQAPSSEIPLSEVPLSEPRLPGDPFVPDAPLDEAGLQEDEGSSTTASNEALDVWHSEALPVRSTSGVG